MRLKGLYPWAGGNLSSILHRGGTEGDVGEMKRTPEVVCRTKAHHSRAGEVYDRGSPGQDWGPRDLTWDVRRKDHYNSASIGR